MIEQKIATARQAKRKRFYQTLISIVLLSIACVVLLFWVSMPKNSSESDSDERLPSQTSEPVGESAEQDTEALRQAYLDAYAHYQNTLKPELNKIELPQWDAALAKRLAEQESVAVKQFGEARYAEAKILVDRLVQTAETAIEDSRQQFESAMQNAREAFDDNAYQPAKQAIETAMLHDNTSTEAAALAERIEQLPEIAELVRQIDVARVENDRQKELSLINQLLTLTPERDALKQRAKLLQSEIDNQRYSASIAQAYAELENGRLTSAKSALEQARKIYPTRDEIADVSSAIQRYETDLQVKRNLSLASEVEAKDDWQQVKSYLEQAVKAKPDQQQANEKLAIANKILALQQQQEALLNSPYRLSNQQVADQARQTLNQAAQYRQQSATLAQQSQQLQSLLTAVNQSVNVEVRSDNQTYIQVRGVGHVGLVDSKVIQLKPGQYTFEGKRAGFKSKLMEVTIPYDASRFSLTLVCDEPI